jgi:hypothetical protein
MSNIPRDCLWFVACGYRSFSSKRRCVAQIWTNIYYREGGVAFLLLRPPPFRSLYFATLLWFSVWFDLTFTMNNYPRYTTAMCVMSNFQENRQVLLEFLSLCARAMLYTDIGRRNSLRNRWGGTDGARRSRSLGRVMSESLPVSAIRLASVVIAHLKL